MWPARFSRKLRQRAKVWTGDMKLSRSQVKQQMNAQDDWPPTVCSGCGGPVNDENRVVCRCHKEGGPHEEDAWCSMKCMEGAHAVDVDDWREER